MSLLHGPMLQRALTIRSVFIDQNSTVTFAAARVLPDGFSGYVTGANATTSVLTHNFSQVLNSFRTNVYAPISMQHDNCGENCTGSLEGFGFDVKCHHSTEAFNVEATYANATQGAIVFSTSVDFDEGNATTNTAGTINLEAKWKGTANCKTSFSNKSFEINCLIFIGSGDLNVRRCTLKAGKFIIKETTERYTHLIFIGIRRYPVIFSGSNGVALVNEYYKNDTFLNYTTIKPAIPGGRSTIGGLAFSIGTIFTSSVNMSYTGNPAYGYNLRKSIYETSFMIS